MALDETSSKLLWSTSLKFVRNIIWDSSTKKVNFVKSNSHILLVIKIKKIISNMCRDVINFCHISSGNCFWLLCMWNVLVICDVSVSGTKSEYNFWLKSGIKCRDSQKEISTALERIFGHNRKFTSGLIDQTFWTWQNS